MRHEKAGHVGAIASTRRRENSQRLGAIFRLLFLEPGRDFVEGLVPAHRFKTAFALLAGSSERSFQSLGRVQPLRRGMGLGAEPAPVQRRFLHPGDANKFPVPDGGVNPAPRPWPAHGAEGRDSSLLPFLSATA